MEGLPVRWKAVIACEMYTKVADSLAHAQQLETAERLHGSVGDPVYSPAWAASAQIKTHAFTDENRISQLEDKLDILTTLMQQLLQVQIDEAQGDRSGWGGNTGECSSAHRGRSPHRRFTPRAPVGGRSKSNDRTVCGFCKRSGHSVRFCRELQATIYGTDSCVPLRNVVFGSVIVTQPVSIPSRSEMCIPVQVDGVSDASEVVIEQIRLIIVHGSENEIDKDRSGSPPMDYDAVFEAITSSINLFVNNVPDGCKVMFIDSAHRYHWTLPDGSQGEGQMKYLERLSRLIAIFHSNQAEYCPHFNRGPFRHHFNLNQHMLMFTFHLDCALQTRQTMTMYIRTDPVGIMGVPDNLEERVNEIVQDLTRRLDEAENPGSGWIYDSDEKFLVEVTRFDLIQGSKFEQLPDTLKSMQSLMNPHNDADQCFIYCIARAFALKDKSKEEVANAMEEIFRDMPGYKKLHVDYGREFYNRTMDALLKKYRIKRIETREMDWETSFSKMNDADEVAKLELWSKFITSMSEVQEVPPALQTRILGMDLQSTKTYLYLLSELDNRGELKCKLSPTIVLHPSLPSEIGITEVGTRDKFLVLSYCYGEKKNAENLLEIEGTAYRFFHRLSLRLGRECHYWTD
ncbi:unnamed protein product [Darwinula stevensoni]|uniref:Uncharacterized protein n=1 Tax=Darwinula stevensoni TaxID=69355 RepID=A0A7R8X928_9CRUS|nr:unnamed protein product [Darwinula stevensoni]CAG0888580.1 unnamed protein product [Darwinula stevensoni]